MKKIEVNKNNINNIEDKDMKSNDALSKSKNKEIKIDKVEKIENNKTLLEELQKKYSLKEISVKLNLAVGTVQRWIELDNIPIHYHFDLLRLLSKDVNYKNYKSSQKDQFFTPIDIAEKCWEKFKEITKVTLNEYTFIEPSAGDGSFFKLLPENSIGLDIEPRCEKIIKKDYLSWKPELDKKYIVVGNPPFGLRGHTALNFINHSHSFADYVAFILPQLFESDGKGSPRKRVQGYNLIYSEKLAGLFHTPEKTEVEINGVFQIWSKHTSNKEFILESNKNDKLTIYSLSDGGTVATTRNKNMLDICDIYLPSTCFGKEAMKLYSSFESLPNRKGYGIVFKKNKKKMIEKSKKIDWSEIAFLSTNSAYNLRTSLITKALL